MNDTIILESFLNYCDEMIIAEEGYSEIISKYRRLESELKSIQDDIENEDDIAKILRLLNKQLALTREAKSMIVGESEIGFSGVGTMIQSAIIPLILGILTAYTAKRFSFNIYKTDDAFIPVTLGSGTVLSLGLGQRKIVKVKNTKKDTLEQIDRLLKAIEETIEGFNYAVSKGYYRMSDLFYMDNSKICDIRSMVDSSEIYKKLFKTSKPANKLSNSISKYDMLKYADTIEKDVLAFLQNYADTKEFKLKYPHAISDIEIRSCMTDSILAIRVSKKDKSDLAKTDWCDELIGLGIKFISFKYANWKGYIWNDIIVDNEIGAFYVN